MSVLDDLEPQQYQEIYFRTEEPLEELRTFIYRRILFFSMAAFLLFIILGFFIKIPRELHLDFTLMDRHNEQEYIAEQDIFVSELYVKQQQNILQGQSIAKITSSEILNQLNKYNEIKELLEQHKQYGILLLKNKIELLDIEIMSLVQQKQKAEFIFANTQKETKIRIEQLKYETIEAQQRLQENQTLYNSKAISKWEFKNFEASYNSKQMQLDTALLSQKYLINHLERELIGIDLRKNTSEKQQEQLQLDFQSKLENLQQELMRINKTFDAKYKNMSLDKDGIILKASQSGKIGFLYEINKLLPKSATLYKIIHAQSNATAQIQVNSNNIGLLKNDMNTHLRINTFPYYEYGFLSAKIDNISIVPNKDGNYLINLKILDYGKLKDKTNIGMKGNAVVILEGKSLFSYIFHKITQTIN
jgi:multidrug efflux pump subunit AcrA (membrane-fusion protein)